jgi:hypothetical protein
MPEGKSKPENIADSIEQENSAAINKIRSLFVDPGFPSVRSEAAGSAPRSEKLKDGEV